MHFQAPAAAVLCAILVAILLGPVAVSPGPGLWMAPVAAGLILLGVIWKLVDHSRARAEPPPREQMATPFGAGVPRVHAATPGFYGPQGGMRQPLREERPAGVHAAFILIVAGIMFGMVHLGVIFAEGTTEIPSDQAAAAAEEAKFENAAGAEQPAASPDPQAEATAERETDEPPPTPAVTKDASPAQVAAARAAAEAAEENEENATASESSGDEVVEATPAEMEDGEDSEGEGGTAPADEPVEEPQPREYVVQQGDSIYGIAQAHNLLMRELLEWNPALSPSSLIHPGEVLILPPPSEGDLIASAVEDDSSDDEMTVDDEEEDLLLEE